MQHKTKVKHIFNLKSKKGFSDHQWENKTKPGFDLKIISYSGGLNTKGEEVEIKTKLLFCNEEF